MGKKNWKKKIRMSSFKDRSTTCIKCGKKPWPKKTSKDEESFYESDKKELSASDKSQFFDQPMGSKNVASMYYSSKNSPSWVYGSFRVLFQVGGWSILAASFAVVSSTLFSVLLNRVLCCYSVLLCQKSFLCISNFHHRKSICFDLIPFFFFLSFKQFSRNLAKMFLDISNTPFVRPSHVTTIVQLIFLYSSNSLYISSLTNGNIEKASRTFFVIC